MKAKDKADCIYRKATGLEMTCSGCDLSYRLPDRSFLRCAMYSCAVGTNMTCKFAIHRGVFTNLDNPNSSNSSNGSEGK